MKSMSVKKLNPDQAAAVSYTQNPLLILAGPGSGKTFTITEKVGELVKSDISTEKILALTFSEKAADEMLHRIEEKVGLGTGITISTFHAFCNNLIKDYAIDMGISSDFTVISKEHAIVWGIKNIDLFNFEYLNIPFKSHTLIEELWDGVSRFHDQMISPDEFNKYLLEVSNNDENSLNELLDFAKFYTKYQEYKWNNSFIDYSDMISLACKLLETNVSARKSIQQLYDYILVDEFQDTNYAQLRLIELLSIDNNLTCVADDDQCIYRFRGANFFNIHKLEQMYSQLHKIVLGVNYRSVQPIVNLSQQLIQKNSTRQDKQIIAHKTENNLIKVVKAPDDVSEAVWVADEIQRLIDSQGVQPEDIYILTRKKADGKKFYNILKDRSIPVEYVGDLSIQDFPIIQEVLAYIQFVAYPFTSGVAFAKILFREGVTDHTLRKINLLAHDIKKEHKVHGDGIYTVLLHHLNELQLAQEELVTSIVERMHKLIEYKKNHLPSDTLIFLLRDITNFYSLNTSDCDTQALANIKILNKLVSIVKDLEIIDGGSDFEMVADHLKYVFDLDMENGDSSDANSVKIMTIHQSKGKEAKIVFLCDLADRHLPTRYQSKKFTVPVELTKDMQHNADLKALHLEEERRLMYVAMTRAQEHLYLVYPQKYAGNKNNVKNSVFLDEIEFTTNPLIELIEAKEVVTQINPVVRNNLIKKIAEQTDYINMYVSQGQLKSALESLIILAQLQELKKSGTLEHFDVKRFLTTNIQTEIELNNLIENKWPSLVDTNMFFSATNIKTYEDCPLKFKFDYILKIPTPKNNSMYVGTTVHKVLKQLSMLKKQGDYFDLNIAQSLLDELWDVSIFESQYEATQNYKNIIEMLEFWIKTEKNSVNEMLLTEDRFDLLLSGCHFTGSIDRLDKVSSDDFIVIDYKTGKTTLSKNKLAEDIQMTLYCLAVKHKFGKLPAQICHMYLHPENTKSVIVNVTEDNIKSVISRIDNLVQKILQEDFTPSKNDNVCRMCDYTSLCEVNKI